MDNSRVRNRRKIQRNFTTESRDIMQLVSVQFKVPIRFNKELIVNLFFSFPFFLRTETVM